jgi:predicted metal-binding membrane protein
VGGDDGRHDGSVGHPYAAGFTTISRSRRAQGRAFVPLWVFLAGYLVL